MTEVVRCSPMTTQEATALYRFFDRPGNLLYVGVTRDPAMRLAQHGAAKGWWQAVADIKIAWYDSRHEALDAERAAIKAERPVHNVVHNTGRQCGARRRWQDCAHAAYGDCCQTCRRIMAPVHVMADGEAIYACPCGERWSCWWAIGPVPVDFPPLVDIV